MAQYQAINVDQHAGEKQQLYGADPAAKPVMGVAVAVSDPNVPGGFRQGPNVWGLHSNHTGFTRYVFWFMLFFGGIMISAAVFVGVYANWSSTIALWINGILQPCIWFGLSFWAPYRQYDALFDGNSNALRVTSYPAFGRCCNAKHDSMAFAEMVAITVNFRGNKNNQYVFNAVNAHGRQVPFYAGHFGCNCDRSGDEIHRYATEIAHLLSGQYGTNVNVELRFHAC